MKRQLRNMPLYVRILAAIAREAKAAKDVAREIGASSNATIAALRLMRGQVAYVESYRRSDRGLPAAMWRLGTEPDCDTPHSVTLRPQAAPMRRTELVAFNRIMRAMAEQPATIKALQELSGCNPSTVRRVVNDARRLGIVHVAEWDRVRNAGDYAPHFAVAVDQPDAVKPKAMPRRQIERRYWEARKAKERAAKINGALASNAPDYAAVA